MPRKKKAEETEVPNWKEGDDPATKPGEENKVLNFPKNGDDGDAPEESAEGAESETPSAEDESLEIQTPEKGKKGRQARLPGAEDPEIEELEDLALDYAEKRDRRLRAQSPETEAKKDLLAAMKKRKLMKYEHGGYIIERTVKEETLVVKVPKGD